MSDFTWYPHPTVGGIVVRKIFQRADYMQFSGTARFDVGALPQPAFKRICTILERGYMTSLTDESANIITMLCLDCGLPDPQLSYVGKKELRLVVGPDRVADIRDQLQAAGHMIDAEFSKHIRTDTTEGLIYVRSYQVTTTEANSHSWRAARAIKNKFNLTPQYSKLYPLITEWLRPLMPVRQPMLDYLRTFPVVDINLRGRR